MLYSECKYVAKITKGAVIMGKNSVIGKRFVCDLGFSSAKCLGDDIPRFRVLTVYQERGGQKTLIGTDALHSSGGVSYVRTPDQLVRYYPLFLEKCLDEAGIQNAVAVAVGLPAKFYEDQLSIVGGAIEQLASRLQELERVESVIVLPQGMGGIRDFIFSDQNKKKKGLLLGIDFGHNTIIYTLYDGEQGKAVYTDTLYKRGISQMVEHYLMPKIRQHISGFAMNPVEISKLLEQGFLPVGTDRIDLKPEITTAANEYMDHIIAEIMEDIKGNISALRPIDTIVFFGGGAVFLENRVQSDKIDVVVLSDPEYANARGFLSFLEV